MNERIRQLADGAETKEIGYYFFDKEKFAELIVSECIQQSLAVSHRDDDMGAIIADRIREHFGVKE